MLKKAADSPANPGAPRRAVPRARPQCLKKDAVEVKVEQRSDSFHLRLNFNLNLNLLENSAS